MKKPIKVRRPGIERIFRKSAFRAWLDEQPRHALKYRADVGDKDGTGWKTEDFVLEAMKRGVDVRWSTVFKWASGSQPRWMARRALEKAFPEIRF